VDKLFFFSASLRLCGEKSCQENKKSWDSNEGTREEKCEMQWFYLLRVLLRALRAFAFAFLVRLQRRVFAHGCLDSHCCSGVGMLDDGGNASVTG
jgi:hypothetical protein